MHTIARFLISFLLGILPLLAFISGDVLIEVSSNQANAFSILTHEDPVPYCSDPAACGLEAGKDAVGNGLSGIDTSEKKFVDYLQEIIIYFIGFLALISLVLFLYAGWLVLSSAGNEDNIKKAKGIFRYVIIGVLIIFLSYGITRFIFGDSTGKGILNPTSMSQGAFATLLPTAQAADLRTFADYKTEIENLVTQIDKDIQINGKVKIVLLQELQSLVSRSVDTLPDNSDSSRNKALSEDVLAKIAVLKKFPSSDVDIDKLANSLKLYVTSVKIGKITAKITATPAEGNAPLNVTLRAVEAKDPSGTQIPNSNYIWWLRTAGGGKKVIATGPSVFYRFDSEAVYSVNLEIRSASKNSKGNTDVLPFTGVQEVKVLPKLANILLYVNGANVSNVDTYKITPSVGRAGVLIDATSSTASPGAQIIKTEWDFGNGERVAYNGAPKLERRVYGIEGTYTVKLSITTNESPAPIIKELRIQSQDPIASIRADKVTGYAGDEFKFQAASNVGNGLFRFEWSVLESDSGKVLFTGKSQSMNYKFPRMGFYIVKLKTTSAGGKEDTDNLNIRIDSRDPTANFEARMLSSEMPNVITLDATKSYDPDSKDASKLTFSWTIDGERVELDNSQRNGAIGQYTFTTKGTHSIVLDLANEQGKVTQSQKDFVVDSLLSVKLVPTPKVSQLGNEVTFVAEARDATVFEWDFGDGTRENSTEARVVHSYKAAGIYQVKLTVRGNQDAGNANTIYRTVYVSEADTPFAGISAKRDSDFLELTPDICSGNAAYVVDRSKPIQLSAADSINTDGTTSNLNYSWKYLGKTSTQRDFSLKIDELGCFPITLTVKSQKVNKEHSITQYVRVENALPTFSGLTISADKLEADPVVITVSANNPSDPDGVIVSYLWYYYTDSDPEPQDFRITRTPKTTFVVPRINGKYYFAVTMEDSNGAKLNSEENRDEKYSITLASDNINTPLISLKTSKNEARVGEEVTFQATTKNVIGQDLTDKAEYKWDFDGDGFYDKTTAVPTVSYKYDAPGMYNMKVKAGYKGVSNTRYQQISVRNDLEPSLEYFAIGNKYIFMNTTAGTYKSAKWKLGESSSENLKTWTVSVDEDTEPGAVELEVSDGLNSKTTKVELKKDTVNAKKIAASKDDVVILAYPEITDGVMTIKNEGDPAYIYLGESKSAAKYVIDLDTKTDSDLNGDPADDADNMGTDSYTTGAPFALANLEKLTSRTVRIKLLDSNNSSIASSDFKLVLSYVDDGKKPKEEANENKNSNISDDDKKSIALLKDLVKTTAPESKRVQYMQFISQMIDDWGDDNAKTKTIIDFQQAIGEDSMTQSNKDKFLTILDSFLLSDSEAKDEIGLAVSVLKKLIPQSNPHYEEMFGTDGKGGIVADILSHPTQLEQNRKLGETMLGFIKTDTNISDDDKLILKEQIKLIIYGGSKNIPAEAVTQTQNNTEEGSVTGILMNVAYIFGGIIALIVVIFILLFIFYKMTSKNPEQGFQDFIIENVFGSGGSSSQKTTPTPVVTVPVSTPAPTPVYSQPIPAVSVPVTPAAPTAPVTPVVPVAPTTHASFASSASASSASDVMGVQTGNYSSQSTFAPASSSVVSDSFQTASESVDAGIPDWLKSAMSQQDSTQSPVVESPYSSELQYNDQTESDNQGSDGQASDNQVTDSVPNITSSQNQSFDTVSDDFAPDASVSQNIETVPTQEQETPSLNFSLDDATLEKMTESIDTRIPPSSPKSFVGDAKQPISDISQNGVNTADLPDWLKGVSAPQSNETIASTDAAASNDVDESVANTASMDSEDVASNNSIATNNNAPSAQKKQKKSASGESKNIGQPRETLNEISPTVTTDDLPDWLK